MVDLRHEKLRFTFSNSRYISIDQELDSLVHLFYFRMKFSIYIYIYIYIYVYIFMCVGGESLYIYIYIYLFIYLKISDLVSQVVMSY